MPGKHGLVNVTLALQYGNDMTRCSDIMHMHDLDLDRAGAELPAMVYDAILQAAGGAEVNIKLQPGELVPAHDPDLLKPVGYHCFVNANGNTQIEPRTGRFYPAAWFAQTYSHYTGIMKPSRLTSISNDDYIIDFNHPLSCHELTLNVTVENSEHDVSESARPGIDLQEFLSGPGMQLATVSDGNPVPTDFFEPGFNRRIDENDDAAFYSMPRMVNHIDDTACSVLENLYAELIPNDSDILDLMSSVTSHLHDGLKTASVTGLGMNRDELENNTRLDNYSVHDLNQDPKLPYADNQFDAVICSLSVEYLTSPVAVFREAARVLRHNGLFITSFSNRWFPTKAVKLWPYLHEFERMGLVAEYFTRAGNFGPRQTYSCRGLPRPGNDRYRLPSSDPVYAVWANVSK